MILDEWQEEVLNYEGDLLLCTGRRVGKTQIMAIKCGEFMIKHPNKQVVIASLTEDQAKLIIVMILEYLDRNHKDQIAKGKNKPTQSKIILKNKSRAIARPVGNTGDAIRGFNGDVLILDEVSRFNEMILTAATPILLTTGGQIWMASTPFGKRGYFYEQFNKAYNKKDPEARFKVFYKSSEEVIYNRPISASWTENQRAKAIKFLEEEKKDKSNLEYGQEYMGLFLEDLQQYFSDELIAKACILKRREYIHRDKDYYLGVDVARMGGDETTFEIVEMKSEDYIEHVESIIMRKILTTRTEEEIINLNKLYKEIQKIYIDAGSGSLGVGIFDHLLKHDDIKSKITAINNLARPMNKNEDSRSKILKEDLYDNLRYLMESGKIKLLDDDSVRLSLKSIQYEFIKMKDKNTRMRIFGNYSHVTEGLIRAAWCVKEKSLNVWMSSIRI